MRSTEPLYGSRPKGMKEMKKQRGKNPGYQMRLKPYKSSAFGAEKRPSKKVGEARSSRVTGSEKGRRDMLAWKKDLTRDISGYENSPHEGDVSSKWKSRRIKYHIGMKNHKQSPIHQRFSKKRGNSLR